MIDPLKHYNFVDDHGHKLENCQEYQDLLLRLEVAERNLNTCKNDYWFMINLIENYGTDKDQTLKDCLERMKFRKGLFKQIEKLNK